MFNLTPEQAFKALLRSASEFHTVPCFVCDSTSCTGEDNGCRGPGAQKPDMWSAVLVGEVLGPWMAWMGQALGWGKHEEVQEMIHIGAEWITRVSMANLAAEQDPAIHVENSLRLFAKHIEPDADIEGRSSVTGPPLTEQELRDLGVLDDDGTEIGDER